MDKFCSFLGISHVADTENHHQNKHMKRYLEHIKTIPYLEVQTQCDIVIMKNSIISSLNLITGKATYDYQINEETICIFLTNHDEIYLNYFTRMIIIFLL